MDPFNWTCRFCNRPQVATDKTFSDWFQGIYSTEGARGQVGIHQQSIVCQNPDCRKLTLTVCLNRRLMSPNGNTLKGAELERWSLLPESDAKPQPEFIPAVLREDYREACRIRDLSPKASATLARRCLQGMIRDFCGIVRPTLFKEISDLETLVETGTAPKGVTPESVEAIDHVRKIGNIGAHMEGDVNLIIDIEPDEAQLLIELIETLFEEWYVAREARAVRLAKIAALREAKDGLTTAASGASGSN